MKKTLISLGIILSLTSSSFAASWAWLLSEDNGTQIYIDNDSVQKDNQTADVFIKLIENNGCYSIRNILFNRYDRTYKIKSSSYFYANNDPYREVSSYSQYELIPPEGIMDTIYHSIW